MIIREAPPSPSLDARFERLPTLDGLRAVSIMMVMLSHFVNARLFPGGLGVLIFFVISGFLITRLLLSEYKTTGSVNIRDFYLRRVIRLYPVVVAYAILAVLVFSLTGRSNQIELKPILSALFYFANYYYSNLYVTHSYTAMPFSIAWSLSVEEHFYIVFPVLFAALVDLGGRLRIAVLILCIIPLLARVIFVTMNPIDDPAYSFITYYQTQYRIDSIAFGVLLALLLEVSYWQNILRRLEHPLALSLGIVAILGSLLWRDPIFRETLRYTVQAVAVVVILYNLLYSQSPLSRFIAFILNLPLVVFVGKLSYSLYFWHFFAGAFGPTSLPTSGLAVLNFVMSFAFATASYYWLETPFVALRERFRTVKSCGRDEAADATSPNENANRSKPMDTAPALPLKYKPEDSR
ncbi:acyltransferase family protein [Bradyrhizobium amphicarpaeae]|uniref:Acyltransferase n=1 Tax=Bradyrhizobium amphicarpaeae TaxID=1404768 RepID=A0A2U8PPJ3_9BRAD|nr:acyltransferase [Bradyrhizobium amphicarpaeae]AWL99651.1 acyltransferase [Bradyrhizobium amphicarpaeae]